MSDAFGRLQDLLRQLFQFESEELDFGIYRIMNHKRGEIRRFIDEGQDRPGGGSRRGLRERRLVHTGGQAPRRRLQAADARRADRWLRMAPACPVYLTR